MNAIPELTFHRLDEDAALRAILVSTTAATGEQFFAALVNDLSQALGTHAASTDEYSEESQRLRAEAALRDREEHYRRLVEHAADAFFVVDSEGRFVDVNQRACDSLGYSREELLAMSLAEVELEGSLE